MEEKRSVMGNREWVCKGCKTDLRAEKRIDGWREGNRDGVGVGGRCKWGGGREMGGKRNA